MFKTCNKVELQTPEGTIGHSNLEEVVPSISKPTFIDIERLLGSAFGDYLNELMLEAGREERELAIQ